MGIEVVTPDVQISGASYTPSRGRILHGLGAIKGVGVAGQFIVDERQAHGPYRSLVDLLARVGTRAVNKRVVDALLDAGALDCLGSRRDLAEQYDRLSDTVSDLAKRAAYGQHTLWGNGLVLLT
jgi:DNA polymerase-3 subunit alpha